MAASPSQSGSNKGSSGSGKTPPDSGTTAPGRAAPERAAPEEAARIARELAQALGMDVGEPGSDAAAGGPAGTGSGGSGGGGPRTEGPLKLDRSGALLGLAKLKPVLAHGRADAEDASAATAAKEAAEDADAAAETPRGAPRKATLPPRIGAHLPPGFPGQGEGDPADVEEIDIPGGRFLFGEERDVHEVPPFTIDAGPVTHHAYERFVLETGHRPPLYWPAGRLPDDLRDHPVVGVDYYDALAYARWLEKDLPFEDEWERAARGTDGRVWPWGNDGDLPHANTARSGIKMTLPVGFHPQNVSPDGVKDLVGNVWEITHSPAPGGGLVVRGGSWYDLAYHAKSWFRFAARANARNGTIGFRCVRRAAARSDEPREIDPVVVEAEIAARRGPQPPTDPSGFSADRRDLVPDFRRLRILVAEQKAEEILGPLRGAPTGAMPRHEPFVTAHEAVVPANASRAVTPAPARPGDAQPPVGAPAAAEPPLEREHVSTAKEPPPLRPPVQATVPERLSGARPADTSSRAFADAAEDAARAAARAPAAATLNAAAARTPALLWTLLAAGFVLVLAVLWFVLKDGTKPDAPEESTPAGTPPAVETQTTPDAPARLTEINDLPDMPAYPVGGSAPSDTKAPTVVDGADPAWSDAVKSGPWLLVFAGGDEEHGALTRRNVHALHRRFDGHGVHVALVLGRRFFERADGSLVGATELQASLGAMDAHDGLTVILDPVRDGKSALREGRFGIRSDNGAVLLLDGALEAQSSPPEGGMDVNRLLPIARKAWRLSPSYEPTPSR